MRSSPRSSFVAKDGEHVMEMRYSESQCLPGRTSRILARAFRELGFRICATEEELKKIENPKRLPECLKT
jgi:hypothetical protein